MKKIALTFVAAALLLASPAFAAELNFSLDNASSFSGTSAAGSEAAFTDALRLSGSFSLKGGDIFRLLVSGWGNMGYTPANAQDPVLLGGSLDVLEASLAFEPEGGGTRLALSAGRLKTRNALPFIGLKRFDGLYAAFSFGQVDIALEGGYLGLLGAEDARVFLSAADIDAEGYFAPPRGYAGLSVKFVELFAAQDLLVGASAQIDFRGGTDTVNSQFVEASLSGPIFAGLSYTLGADLEFIQRSLDTLPSRTALAALARLDFAAPAALGSSASLGTKWFSGTSGTLSPFFPIADSGFGGAYSGLSSSLMEIFLKYAMTPVKGLTASLKGSGYARTGEEAPANPGYIAGTAETWLGEEVGLSVNWAPLSDLSVDLGGKMYFPSTGLAYADDAPSSWDASLSLSVKF